MAYRDLVRDEAVAAAKAWAHAEVEPRHLLWGLLEVLGDEAPAGVPRAAVRAILLPRGAATASPTLSAAIEGRLANVKDRASAMELCTALAVELLTPPGSPGSGDPGPGGTHGGPSATASATHAATEAATEAVAPEPATTQAETVAALLAELDALVGLDAVKASVRRLVAVQRLNAERRAQGLPEVSGSHHVVFTGPPGTGKTTVARLIGRLYGAIGVVSKGHLVEASRPDLVAGYVGQTALKVQEVVQRALGGVLFIDEAYALAQGEGRDFGEEAVATLVKLMEDRRDDLAVIVAGYPDEMRTFIGSNPGLRSRFTHTIEFPDYSADELVRIFASIAAAAKVDLAPDVARAVAVVVERVKGTENFGNARYVRSLFERAYANMAQRALADDRIESVELATMLAADIPSADTEPVSSHRQIGFRAR